MYTNAAVKRKKSAAWFQVAKDNIYLLDQFKTGNSITDTTLINSDFNTKIKENDDFNLEYFVKGKIYHEDLNLEYYAENSGFKSAPSSVKDILKGLVNSKKTTDIQTFVNNNENNIAWDLIRWQYYMYRGRNYDLTKGDYPEINDFTKINTLHSNYFEQTNFSKNLQSVCFSRNMLGYYALELPSSISALLYKDSDGDTYEVDLKVLYKLILKDIIGVSVTSA
jgi:hypothetical protein